MIIKPHGIFMSKKVIFSLFLILICFTKLQAQPVNIVLKPLPGLFYPGSRDLRAYYSKEFIFTYGGEVDILSNFYDIGIYIKVNEFSVKIDDPVQTDLEQKSTWYGLGIMKKVRLSSFNVDTKIGLTKHDDDLALPGEEKSRVGYELGISANKQMLGRLYFFMDANYNYESVKISDYRTFAYSRHQHYLAGKEFSTGGYQLFAGLSVQLF